MPIKPDWDIFKAKFSENPQENFEWFCYLLFTKEYNQPFGIHRYKNQSAIETDPILINDEVIGWQAKFYEDNLSKHKDELIATIEKAKRDYPGITKIILYTNSEWGQGKGGKAPVSKIKIEQKAKELNIELVLYVKSYFESTFVCIENEAISKYFFLEEMFIPDFEWVSQKTKNNIKSVGKRYAPNDSKYMEINIKNNRLEEYFEAFDIEYILNQGVDIFYSGGPCALNKLVEIDLLLPSYESAYQYYCQRFGSDNGFKIQKDDLIDLPKVFEHFKCEILDSFYSLARLNIDEFHQYFTKFQYYLELFLKHVEASAELFQLKFPNDVHDTYYDDLTTIYNYRVQIVNALNIIQSDKFQVFEKKVLLLIGEALIGKTHLFCDMALNRLEEMKPTLLFFGNLFDCKKSILKNIMNQLGLADIDDQCFLDGLNLLASKYQTKTLIMIDAINEKDAGEVFREDIIRFCEEIKRYQNLALAMSVRDVEKNKISTSSNEDYINSKIVEVEHKGFEGIELDAVRTFCDALGVEFPKVPLHTHRLFVNPGILFLYIETIKSNKQKIDTSIINPLQIFHTYIEELERKFYQLYPMEVDIEDETVIEAIRELVALGLSQDFIHFYLDYRDVKTRLKPLHKKVLEFLISEGVLYKINDRTSVKVDFTYQKFENFFVADFILNSYEENKKKIYDLIRGHHRALIEALLMQIPEKLDTEIFDLNKWFLRDYDVCELYLSSLVWRDPKYIYKCTHEYINFILGYKDLVGLYLDTILQLSTIPKHPLNIEILHNELLRLKLADRDYYWSMFLHESFANNTITKRLIDWAWNKNESFEIEDKSLYLYGLTLGWFLTSSNRVLRDSATKALVNIFTNKVEIFLEVLQAFESVDDLYVLERLYAVAYGITLRSSCLNGVRELGIYIYEIVFNTDVVLEHILLREYASFTIEYINQLNDIGIDIEKIHPPYNQNIDWTLSKIEKAEVEIYRDNSSSLYWSALDGDFKIYQVYPAINHFLNLKISDRPHGKLIKERYDEFFDSLTYEQREEYHKTSLQPHEILALINKMSINEFEEEIEISNLDADQIDMLREMKLNQSNFKKLLSEAQLKEYDSFIVSYKKEDEYRYSIDIKSIKRLIFLEAVKLGWKAEFFEAFDRRAGSHSRHEHQTERIGKKYQWISFHSILARLADNYEYQNGRSANRIATYEGTYQLRLRDIDPTSILKNKTQKDKKWWFNLNTDFENSAISDNEWMGSMDKLPTISQLVEIEYDDKYLLQSMGFSIDGNISGEKYRNLYYKIDAYVVKKSNLNVLVAWLERTNVYGQDAIAHADSIQETFLREYPYSKTYDYFNDYYYGQMGWEDVFNHKEGVMPCKILPVTTSYYNEGRSYDRSVNETIEVLLPNKWLIDKMNLRQTTNDGEWVNMSNEVVFFDPTINDCCVSEYNENGVLIAQKKLLFEFLENNAYTIVWIMWGEKQVRNVQSNYGGSSDFLGIAEITGYGYYNESFEFVEELKIKYEQ